MPITSPGAGTVAQSSWAGAVTVKTNDFDALFTDLAAGWVSWTPTWQASGTAPALLNGTLLAKRKVQFGVCHFRLFLQIGSSTTMGTGTYSFTVDPSVPLSTDMNSVWPGGAWALFDTSAGLPYMGPIRVLSGAIAPYRQAEPVTQMTPTSPITLAVGDQLSIAGFYRTA